MEKKRVDVLLVERGLAESRAQAQALVLAGLVPGFDKPGTQVAGDVELPFAPQLVTCDVSFISVRVALPPVLRLATPGWQALVLVKPQFEADRGETQKGVVRDPEIRRRVVRGIVDAAIGRASCRE